MPERDDQRRAGGDERAQGSVIAMFPAAGQVDEADIQAGQQPDEALYGAGTAQALDHGHSGHAFRGHIRCLCGPDLVAVLGAVEGAVTALPGAVDRRWATTSVVRPSIRRERAA